MSSRISRRTVVKGLSGAILGAGGPITRSARPHAFVFTARGGGGFLGGGEKPGRMNSDGTGFHLFDFHRANEVGFGIYGFFADGHHALMLSIEKNEDWKTKSFYEYYPKSRTHIWKCDLRTGRLTELATKERIAPFYAPCGIVPGEKRILVSINQNGSESLYSMNLDGTGAVRLTKPGEYVYGVSISHDGKRVAFHADYRIYTMGIDGTNRTEVAGRNGWIYFGTSWAPDDSMVLFQVCNPAETPGHDWSDIWIGRPDGSEIKALTTGASAWFDASYGTKTNPGRGSIMPKWAPDGSGILYSRRIPGSVLPWQDAVGRKDTDHFNRDFRPDLATGGTQICSVNPRTGVSAPITHCNPPSWEFRPDWSPDSKKILFCRAAVGENPVIWVVDRDGSNERKLTDGNGNGGEFPRWLPARD